MWGVWPVWSSEMARERIGVAPRPPPLTGPKWASEQNQLLAITRAQFDPAPSLYAGLSAKHQRRYLRLVVPVRRARQGHGPGHERHPTWYDVKPVSKDNLDLLRDQPFRVLAVKPMRSQVGLMP